MAGINVTIRNSRFVNCMGVDDVFIKGDFGPIKNFLIENNFFGYASLFTVRLSGQTSPRPCDGVLVRYNSSLQRMWSDCNATGAGIRFTSPCTPRRRSIRS